MKRKRNKIKAALCAFVALLSVITQGAFLTAHAFDQYVDGNWRSINGTALQVQTRMSGDSTLIGLRNISNQYHYNFSSTVWKNGQFATGDGSTPYGAGANNVGRTDWIQIAGLNGASAAFRGLSNWDGCTLSVGNFQQIACSGRFVVDRAATCSQEGVGHYVCNTCGNIYRSNVPIQKIAHTMDDGIVTLNPTVYKNGILTYTCTVCGVKEDTEIPKYQFSIFIGTKRISKVAKGSKLLFEDTTYSADLLPLVSE